MPQNSQRSSGLGIVQNIGWGLAYLLGAWIGLELAVPPGSISPIWPAAGVALAGFLTHGLRVLPGLFLGCYAVQLIAFSDFSSSETGLHSLLIALAVSTGSLLQAWTGNQLVRRLLDWPSHLARIGDILRFVFLGALLACTIAPTVGVTTLYLSGAFPAELLPQVWTTWWVGDSLGVVITTPLLLAFFGQPRQHWRPRRLSLGLALTATLLLLFGFFRFSLYEINQRIAIEFDQQVHKTLTSLQMHLRDFKHRLDAVAGHLASQASFAPGVLSSEPISSTNDPQVEFLLYSDAGIQALSSPMETGGKDCGLERRAAQRPETGPSLLALPGDCGVAIVIPAQRRDGATSRLIGQIRATTLHELTAGALPDGTGVRLSLQEQGNAARRLVEIAPDISPYSKEISFRPRAHSETTLLGSRLVLDATGSSGYVTSSYGWDLWAILVAGFSFSGLLGISLLGLTGQRALISELVKQRTGELSREVDDHERTARVLELHNRVLEMIATDNPLQQTLDFICREFEGLSRPGTYASVMLVDRQKHVLRMAAGPSIPRPVHDALLEFPIGENEGSCGTAVFRGEQVFACDISQDPVWEKYRDFALSQGLRACWSTPFRAPSGEVLGSFALTQTEARSPLPSDLRHIAAAANLCALAVERADNNERLRMLSLAIEQNPSAVVITDVEGRIEYVNSRFSELTGYAVEEIEGRRLPAILESEEESPERQAPWERLRRGLSWHKKAQYRRKDGSLYWAQCRAAPVHDAAGQVTRIVVTHEDVTELHQASERLAHQASHDQLTGLLNRMAFEHRLEEMRQRAVAQDEVHTLCFIDMDRFKAVNDSCGHVGGDELLRQVTRLMADGIRRHDLLARVGGDEFAILFEHCNESQARQNVEKLRELVADYRFLWNEGAFHVGLSAGLVEINANSPSAEELLREADAACYEAKRHGRNQVRSYQPGAIALTHQSGEIEYVNELREALRENRLQLHFQRIHALRPDVPDNIEILVRLQRTDASLLGPDQILPAAERFGLARELDLWVVRQTLTYLAAHPGLHKRLGYVAINLSGLSLSEELADEVISLLDDQGLSGRRLCFEITETAAIANLSQAQHFMARLQDHQVRFALDDFGSGLSSYGYLKTLPVDVLKIDGQFVRDMLEDRSDRAIVRSIAELGQALGRPTVAEFVEQEAMIEVLREIGVDYAQGHAIARPAPLSDFEHRSAPDAADIQF